MKRVFRWKHLRPIRLTEVLFSFVMVALLSTSVQAADLKLSTVFPTSSYSTDVLKKFAKEVNRKTNGQVNIKVYPPGALADPMEQFDLLEKGEIELSFSAGLMHSSKVPEGLFEFSLPCSFYGKMGTTQAAEQFYEFFYNWRDGVVFNKIEEAYKKKGVVYLGGGPGGGYGFLTNFPVKSLDDFRGKQIRTFGTLGTLVLNLGAMPVSSIANPEQYSALQNGTIDGTIYTYYALEAYKLKKVVSHIIYPPVLTTPVLSLYANQTNFNGLSEKHRELIKKTFFNSIHSYTKKAIELENKYIAKAKAEGVKEVVLPAMEKRKMETLARQTWPLAVQRSKDSLELIRLLKEFLSQKIVN